MINDIICVKTLMMLFLKQARRWPMWCLGDLVLVDTMLVTSEIGFSSTLFI